MVMFCSVGGKGKGENGNVPLPPHNLSASLPLRLSVPPTHAPVFARGPHHHRIQGLHVSRLGRVRDRDGSSAPPRPPSPSSSSPTSTSLLGCRSPYLRVRLTRGLRAGAAARTAVSAASPANSWRTSSPATRPPRPRPPPPPPPTPVAVASPRARTPARRPSPSAPSAPPSLTSVSAWPRSPSPPPPSSAPASQLCCGTISTAPAAPFRGGDTQSRTRPCPGP
jgi:hypothetical protein